MRFVRIVPTGLMSKRRRVSWSEKELQRSENAVSLCAKENRGTGIVFQWWSLCEVPFAMGEQSDHAMMVEILALLSESDWISENATVADGDGLAAPFDQSGSDR